MSAPLAAGENVLIIDSKGRRYLVCLGEKAEFHTHHGKIPHADIIGREDGSELTTSGGTRLTILRPRFADFVLKMPRGAQVVYPKDIGPIVVWADIGPGMDVLEAGSGSGALTLGLLRAVGETGRVVTVERRSDHHAQARKTIERWCGAMPANVEMRVGDVEDVIEELRPDRLVLDLPEPWHAARIAATHQPGGAVFCSYLPTIPQVQQLVAELEPAYSEIEVFETLHRTWNVSGRSVRPDHRMIGHTGFVVVGRKVGKAAVVGRGAGEEE